MKMGLIFRISWKKDLAKGAKQLLMAQRRITSEGQVQRFWRGLSAQGLGLKRLTEALHTQRKGARPIAS